MNMPLLSVVLPVYNAQSYVKESIKSILNQTYKNFELIIINDGSTDETSEIIKSFSDGRIILIENNKNLGLSKSLNKGIEKAKGKYIARHDADDISLKDRFKTQVLFLENNDDYGVVGSRSYIIRDNKVVKGHNHPQNNITLKFMTIFDCFFVHGSIIARTNILKLNKYSLLKIHNPPEDFELWNRLTKKTKFYNIKKRLIIYRESSGNISSLNSSVINTRVNKLATENIQSLCHDEIDSNSAQLLVNFFRNNLQNISLLRLLDITKSFYKLFKKFNNLHKPSIKEKLNINLIFYKKIICFLFYFFKAKIKICIYEFSNLITYVLGTLFLIFIIFLGKFNLLLVKLKTKKNKRLNKKAIIFWLPTSEATLFREFNKDSLYTNIYLELSKHYEVYEIWDKIPYHLYSTAKHIFINHTYLRYDLTNTRIRLRFFKYLKTHYKLAGFNRFISKNNSYLLSFEPPAVAPENYEKFNTKLYKKIFTYVDDDVIKNPKKYIKIMFPNSYKNKLPINDFNNRKLLCNFSANKFSRHIDEIYSLRKKIIIYYQNYYPKYFDNYGLGWENSGCSSNGYIENKLSTMSNYKFSLSFENQKNINGYISEKIIDCFLAGTVPIYYGAKNIKKFIPYNAYIDYSKFMSIEKLNDYLQSISENEWNKYINEAQKFLESKYFLKFLPKYFVDTLIKEMK